MVSRIVSPLTAPISSTMHTRKPICTFTWMIFHDWPPDRGRMLARKSFQSLPPGGRIVIHEMLFNNDRTGPFPVAAFNVDMLVAMPGQQYSKRELSTMLREAGFRDIEVKPTFGYWSVLTGVKA